MCGGEITIEKWASGLVIKLLECMHGQWLYCNFVVHDVVLGILATARKELLQAEIEEKQERGIVGLVDEDEYLLQINLEDLEASSRES